MICLLFVWVYCRLCCGGCRGVLGFRGYGWCLPLWLQFRLLVAGFDLVVWCGYWFVGLARVWWFGV